MPASGELIHNAETDYYSVVRLNKDRLADLSLLHTEVYGKAVPPGHFNKKYDTAYTGPECVGFMAYNKQGLPIAFYGVTPCFVEYEGNKILAAQSTDTMTHPGHRYKGMFVELSNKTFDLCKELGIRLVFGFPNQSSYHGAVNKLGWLMTETMSYFVIDLSAIPLVSLSNKIRFLKIFYVIYCRFVLRRRLINAAGVANSVIANGFAGVARSNEFLTYKTYSPSLVIKIRGAKLWIAIKNAIWIGDMEGVTKENFKTIITELKNLARWLGVRQIQFHCSPGTELHQIFASYCPAIPSYPVLFQDFGSPIPLEKIKFTFSDIDIF